MTRNVEWVPEQADGLVWRAYSGKRRVATVLRNDARNVYGWGLETRTSRRFSTLQGAAAALMREAQP